MHLRHAITLGCLALCGARAAEPPLRAAVTEAGPPFVQSGPEGQVTGFVPELFRLIAQRMQRTIVFTQMPAGALFEALDKGETDLLPGPINATPDRAAKLLFTEGYLWSEYEFAARSGEPVASLKDLRGRRLAVHDHTLYAEWAERNATRYGFSIVPTGSTLEAAKAVLGHGADASLGASPVQDYAAYHLAGFSLGLALPETRTHESAAVRRGNEELRDEVEDALRCLKLNGTVARLSKQWLGREPDAEDLENLVVPGYGVPGLAGYDPKPRKVGC
jgi:polar amino acid transport system substrate-binding protein